MKRNIFVPGNILLPKAVDMSLWSTVACDQFSSDAGYWDAVATETANVPSTMHLMLPEAYLDRVEQKNATERINRTMEEYLQQGLFRQLENSYIYVERTLPCGTIRRGLVGCVDLECYDYHEDSVTPVRATEHTVESRLPARVEIRKQAPLEMPHIMLFIDDRHDMVMQNAAIAAGAPVYDFSLMCGGGHVVGRPVQGTNANILTAMLDELTEASLLEEKYGFSDGTIIYAIGDGNHSLAAAKKCWNELRNQLTEEQRENHPARYALVELMNIHDAGVAFHPIHRVVFGVDTQQFIREADEKLFGDCGTEVTMVTAQGAVKRCICAESIGVLIERVTSFCESFADAQHGQVDYIHGDNEAAEFGSQEGNVAILLPTLKKDELFTSVMDTGVFCKKSFSIGEAAEKRYYLECRKISE